jgi:sugar O-acyltransferase (sialic acid O-acetyltransferase NeuD family)
MPIVIYGIGSPIVADVAETCLRLTLAVAAWVRNVDGPSHLPPDARAITAQEITPELTAHEFLVPLFTPGHRRSASQEAMRLGFARPAILVDPTAVIASSTVLADGTYVNSMANVGAATRVGGFGFINRGASIGHHVEIGEFVSIGPGAIIAGGVKVARGAVIGAGAIVLPEQEIGANAVVGAGAVVTRPVAPNCLVTGNPARMVREGIAGYNSVSV